MCKLSIFNISELLMSYTNLLLNSKLRSNLVLLENYKYLKISNVKIKYQASIL